jgi:hypothetical protein
MPLKANWEKTAKREDYHAEENDRKIGPGINAGLNTAFRGCLGRSAQCAKYGVVAKVPWHLAI